MRSAAVYTSLCLGNAPSPGTFSGAGQRSTTTLNLMRHCAYNNFYSGSYGSCFKIPPIVPILHPATTICSNARKGSLRSIIFLVTKTFRPPDVTSWHHPLEADLSGTNVHKLVSRCDECFNYGSSYVER
ncbi:hypothetical protein AVEN_32079-1 [Araneus ventricosus]|uniref:Uncharacterized protein n=1 Tax=Araneus ventricosus TaxID=182803 RepID=A0A4Y2EFH9_ARAVE|nr:hypothetical protein AVEN_32079-1 [Araneus ventricosus]